MKLSILFAASPVKVIILLHGIRPPACNTQTDIQHAPCRTGRAPKRSRTTKADAQGGAKKPKQPKSEQAWEQAQGMELDQSSIADLCRAQECSNNIVISDVCERLRSGRMRIESSPVCLPQTLPLLFHHPLPVG